MAVGGVITNSGRLLLENRAYATPGSTITGVSQWKLGTGNATPNVADTDLQTAVLGPSNFLSGYPTFDNANRKVTTYAFIGAGTGNGNTFAEAGEFNTDASPVMLSHDVFTGIAKTSSVELLIVWTHHMV